MKKVTVELNETMLATLDYINYAEKCHGRSETVNRVLARYFALVVKYPNPRLAKTLDSFKSKV